MHAMDSRWGSSAGRVVVRVFSLLEVLLALAVVAFGVVSVLALVPASMKTSRDSVADTHSAQAAEHLIQSLSASIEAAASSEDWDAVALKLPTSKPAVSEPETGWSDWLQQDGMRFSRAGSDGEYFRIEMRPDGSDVSEFSCICRAWRRPVTVSELESGVWSTQTLSTSEAVSLNVEVSWPTLAPYVNRSKALYALNVFRKAD